ncbi:LysR family transcriptional regulator [Komagataeibacter swingsii]|uniref:LysR family transcriptional regulator n=1 Tax=Komagataeibacter swingsii TaxID=215220 RepID=A0A850P1V3_9PROT|nr:LysR family transcriptional regulator [Komagataeibacter swingsii]AHI25010.1 Transcriptional regulator LysR family [Komagataeibacter xylinus E25]NVN38657.1 LysR family transcriptional regulator [Komagataeibacter swingsii]RFP00640.1 LysR family transcriptional regulator [Komagataeibacter xylinus]RFP05906.1 LysR family transcriptional regulator [Komagataeibacter xylinus]
MTLEQFRIFIAVAQREHVTRAAEALRLTPSTVSHAVTTLEDELGISLFNRVGRRILLTQAGRIFLDEARAIVARVEAACQRMEDICILKSGVLHVWASHTIAGYWLPARLNAFHSHYPGIDVHMKISNTMEVCRAVQDGTVSIGLIEGHIINDDLVFNSVARDQMILIVSPRHPWVTQPPALTDLSSSAWILRERGSGTRSQFEDALQQLGVDPTMLSVQMEMPSNEAVASAVETGEAASVLSASVVTGRLEAGLLHHVPFTLPERNFSLVQHRTRTFSPSETRFVHFLLTNEI